MTYREQKFSDQDRVVVRHNLGAYPLVQIVDEDNNSLWEKIIMFGDGAITHDSPNQFVCNFSEKASGTIIAVIPKGEG